LLAIGGNRLELFLVEVQEERDRILRTLFLAMGAAVLGLLAGVTLTVAVAVFFWQRSPILALLALALVYALGCAGLWIAFLRLQRDWKTLPDTIEQLRKDRECMEQRLR
jgi:uncharacterized membrane protein YqjE